MLYRFRLAGICLSFLIAFALATIYNLNQFYYYGSGLLDSGWFAYLSTHSDTWPIKNPADIGQTYFSTHFSPIFYAYTAIYKTLGVIGMHLPAATFFSLTQGFWYGLLSAAIFQLIEGRLPAHGLLQFLLYVAIALVCTFNGVSLAALVFPHFEIAIPVLLVAYFATALNGKPILAKVLLGIGLLAREDSGLHYFGLFFLMGVYLCWFGEGQSKQGKQYLRIAAACILYAVAAIAVQKINFSLNDNALGRVYMGAIPYQHVTADFIKERASAYFYERMYIYIPFLLCFGYACISRSLLFMLGGFAVLPWVFFSFFGITYLAGTLAYYYAFPLIIAYIWPLIGAYFLMGLKSNRLAATWLIVTTVTACISIAAFSRTPNIEDNKPWNAFYPHWSNAHKKVKALETFFDANSFSDDVAIQDPVAALVPEKLNYRNWSFLLDFKPAYAESIRYLVFYPAAKPIQRSALEKFIAQHGLTTTCTVKNTEFKVAYHREKPVFCDSGY